MHFSKCLKVVRVFEIERCDLKTILTIAADGVQLHEVYFSDLFYLDVVASALWTAARFRHSLILCKCSRVSVILLFVIDIFVEPSVAQCFHLHLLRLAAALFISSYMLIIHNYLKEVKYFIRFRMKKLTTTLCKSLIPLNKKSATLFGMFSTPYGEEVKYISPLLRIKAPQSKH